MSKKCRAILGGSFNPIHVAHLVTANYVYDTKKFEKIIFMPTGNPPHKEKSDLAPDLNRLEMCKIAIKDQPHFKVSDMECNRNDTVYTIDTVRRLRERHPDVDYYMVIGADSLMKLTAWKDYEELLRSCSFVVVNRPGYVTADLITKIQEYEQTYGANIIFVKIPDLDISSTDIRARVEGEESIQYLVTDKVENYIYTNDLYGIQKRINEDLYENIKKKLKKRLIPSRYAHVLSTERTAVKLARIHGYNENKSSLAALLHDCAKNYSDEKKFDLAKRYGIQLSLEERANIDLIHAKLGAEVARDKYFVHDPEILSAIRFHTTGKSDMSPIEKIIYIADFIEPTRTKAENLDEARVLAEESLDEALINILEHTIKHLNEKDKKIDQNTIAAYEYYINLLQEKDDAKLLGRR